MNAHLLLEIFGYIGSALVVVSMLMSSVIKLRIINMTGSIISGTYALIIGSLPLALMNFALITINGYNTYKLLKTEREYDLVEGNKTDSIIAYFVDRYARDIKVFYPEFDLAKEDFDRVFYVCCEGTPSGILLGKEKKDGVLDVVLDIAIDYTTPKYRDTSIGKYMYPKLKEKGISKLEFAAGKSELHVPYLNKMGFTLKGDVYEKEL